MAGRLLVISLEQFSSMGIPDSSLSDLIKKIRSWIPWGGSDISGVSREFWMPNNSFKMCCVCETRLTEFSLRYHCQGCGRVLCGKCVKETGASAVVLDGWSSTTEDGGRSKYCKFCIQANMGHDAGREYKERIDPSTSPQWSSERVRPCFSVESFNGDYDCKPYQSDHMTHFLEAQHHESSPHAVASSSMASSVGQLSPVSFHHSYSRYVFSPPFGYSLTYAYVLDV